MKSRLRNPLFAIVTIIVLVLSLVNTAPAFADDELPPVAPTEEPGLPPTEESVNETPDPEPTEEAASPVAEETALSEEEPTVAEVLEELPQGTEVVVLNEEGDVEPLASEEAAQIILESDPIWCPAGQTPGSDQDDFTQDCTDSYTTVTDLISNLGTKSGSGTIYFTSMYTDSDAVFDHTNTNLDDLTDLTIQGGWNGVTGVGYSLSGITTFNGVPLTISNWGGNVTLNDIAVLSSNGGLDVETDGNVNLFNVAVNNTDDDAGITIDAGGNVTANEVEANDNDHEGMRIEAGGNVTVEDSEFHDNGYDDQEYYDSGDDYGYYESYGASGLYVDAAGDVTLSDLYAEYNGMHGVEIYTSDGNGNVDIFDGGFHDNGWYGTYSESWLDTESIFSETRYLYGGSGVFVDSHGDITLEDLAADDNANYGALLNSQSGDVEIADSDFYGNGELGYMYSSLNFEDDSEDEFDYHFEFENHAGGGFYVGADGAVTLGSVYAVENAGDGGYVDGAGGDVTVYESVFAENGWSNGIFECGWDDECDCDEEDDCWGYEVLNDGLEEFCDEVFFDGFLLDPCNNETNVYAPNFELDMHSEGSDNYESEGYTVDQYGAAGLYIENGGSILLEYVGAYANSGVGADLYANGDITIIGDDESESGFSGNGFLENIHYGGNHTFEFFEDHDHRSFGGWLDIGYSDGLYADAGGNLTITDVYVISNGNDGADLGAAGLVLVQNSVFAENGSTLLCIDIICDYYIDVPASSLFIEYSSDSDFYYEGGETVNQQINLYAGLFSGTGLEVDEADEGVTLLNVIAAANGGYGADLETESNAIITDGGFYENGYGIQAGLELNAEVDFSECGFCLEGFVPTYLDAFLSNHSGLAVDAQGDITLEDVEAAGNALHGAELYSDAMDSVLVDGGLYAGNGFGMSSLSISFEPDDDPQTVDEPSFEEQYGSGLYIESQGRVTLIDVDALENDNHGAEVHSSNKRVVVSCGEYADNGEYGIQAEGAASLELYGPQFSGNGAGDYFFGGTVVQSDDCTIPEDRGGGSGSPSSVIIPVTGGEPITCDGSAPNVMIVLPNGDFVILPCPINEFAVVDVTPQEGLPGPLEDDLDFISALTALVIRENQPVDSLEEPMVVSFLIPEGVDPETLSILFWDGSEWVEVAGHVSEDGLHFEATTSFTGTFVLVMQ